MMKEMQVKKKLKYHFYLEQGRLNTHVLAKVHICCDPAILPHTALLTLTALENHLGTLLNADSDSSVSQNLTRVQITWGPC